MNRIARLVAGAVLAVGVVVPLLGSLDVDSVASELAAADGVLVAAGSVLGVGAVVCGSELHRRLVAASGVTVPARRFAVAYGAAHFVRSLLPFGQAAGPAVVAYAIRNEAGNRYEEGLATATIAELVTTGASLALAATGVVVLIAGGTTDPVFQQVGLAVVLAVVVLCATVAVAWRRRSAVHRVAVVVAAIVRGTVGRASTRVRTASDADAVRERLTSYYAVVDAIASNRRAVAAAFAVSVIGWIALGSALFLSGRAIGAAVPLGVALLVPPASALAGAFPSPGGLGAAELALTGLLAALAGFGLTTAAAVALIYRVCVYWAPLGASGCCALWLSVGSKGESVPARTESPVELDG